jgi:PAS domain S-box-containing protein
MDENTDFFALFDHLDGVALWTASELGEIEYVSSGVEEIYGISAETLQEDFEQLIERIHPEDRDRILDGLAQSPEESLADVHEHRAVKPDGTVRWVHSRRVPIRDDDGTLTMLVGIATDITEQKRRERQLEILNRIIRHDIRNDMAVILGWAELLEEDVTDAGQERLQKILASGEHIVDLTEIARGFIDTVTSTEDSAVKPIALRSVLENELALRKEAFPNAEFVIPDGIPDVEVTANATLGSVFRNLFNNAIQHNDKAAPIVEVTCEERDEDVIVCC